MKFTSYTLLLLALVFFYTAAAQEHSCAKAKQKYLAHRINVQSKAKAAAAVQISHEMNFDVKFVHLDLFLERNTKFIKGGVKTVATVTSAVMDTCQLLLHQVYTIDSVRFNGALVAAVRQDSMVKVKAPLPLTSGSSFTLSIYYKGTAPIIAGVIGNGYDSDTDPTYGQNTVAWSVSEPFLAYTWWPCKQILTDKIDSSWVYVTTDSTNKVGSNGRLKNVVTIGNKKRYEWKSKTPIDYYLISVATARYKEYNLYAKPKYLVNDSILIQNYIYDNAYTSAAWNSSEKLALNKLPTVVNLFSNLFGMYPFYKEKYGHCMVKIGGALEHQTMTSTYGFEYYIDAHELGHQWWGDNVTCKSWADIWINEGFAVYSEILTSEYLDATNLQSKVADYHDFVMGAAGGAVRIPNADTLDAGRIFDSRLTYAKGGSIIHTLRFVTNNDSLWFSTLRGFQNLYKNGTASAIDFKNYYENQTGINATQFFNQWYYGEGFPVFTLRYNFGNNGFYLKSSQSVSMPGVTPLFITPLEYKITRQGMPDTLIRVMHNTAVENYSFAMSGTITGIVCDPNNWVINRVLSSGRDYTLGVDATGLAEKTDIGFAGITIGPNPTNGQLRVFNPQQASGEINLYDESSKLISKQILRSTSLVDLSHLPAGFYFIRFVDTNGREMSNQKVLKQ